jgi:hypothetical protein
MSSKRLRKRHVFICSTIVQLPEPYGLVIVGGLQIDAQNINSMKELVSFILKPLTQLLNQQVS